MHPPNSGVGAPTLALRRCAPSSARHNADVSLPMARFAIAILGAVLLALAVSARACDRDTACDKCAKDSEMSWNPENRYVSEKLKRFYSLDDLIKSAYEANNLSSAVNLAHEYLDLANAYKCNWNYGNAVHDANRYLGLVSLKNGDQSAAVAYLLKSGKSSGSPQLNSFGPDLALADALLQAGHVEPVKLYLRDIKSFWKMENGQIDEWLAGIDKGDRPTLTRFATKPSAMQLALFWFALAWPALVVAACLYLQRRRIAGKWIFGIAGLVVGYVALFVAGWGIAFVLPGILGGLAGHPSVVMPALYLSIAAGFVISLLAVLAASRFFVAKEQAS
jgi:hypothetical protein